MSRNKQQQQLEFEKPLGERFGKADLDRLGFFDDPCPAPFDLYVHGQSGFRKEAAKGRQMLTEPPLKFFEKFTRIFEGEALKGLQKQSKRETEKPTGRLLPPSYPKKHSTPGDWYGCFSQPSYLRPGVKSRPTSKKTARTAEPPNMKIKPNPLGGPGYANICFHPFPTHFPEPYEPMRKRKTGKEKITRFLTVSAPLDFFPPNPHITETVQPTYRRPQEKVVKMIGPGRLYVPFPKKPAGNHSGCFDKFPAYSSEPYIKPKGKAKAMRGFYCGGPPLRSKYTKSIIQHVTEMSCNSSNYLWYKNRAYPE